ncbi:MAG: hypothetical protein WAN59_10645 [Candidatus Baltobacteraceae bacterium]
MLGTRRVTPLIPCAALLSLMFISILSGCSKPPNAFTGKWIAPGKVQGTVVIDDHQVETFDQNGVPVSTLPYRLERPDLLVCLSPTTGQPALSVQMLADGNSAHFSTINAGYLSRSGTIYRAK